MPSTATHSTSQSSSDEQQVAAKADITPEIETVAEAVEHALEPLQPSEGYRLIVRHDLIRRHKGCWFVVVQSDPPDAPLVDVIDRMSKADEAIYRTTPRWVRLTSQLPDAA